MYKIPDYDPKDKTLLKLPDDEGLWRYEEEDESPPESPRVWTWRRVFLLMIALLIIAAMLVTYSLFFVPDLLHPPIMPTPIPRPGSVI